MQWREKWNIHLHAITNGVGNKRALGFATGASYPRCSLPCVCVCLWLYMCVCVCVRVCVWVCICLPMGFRVGSHHHNILYIYLRLCVVPSLSSVCLCVRVCLPMCAFVWEVIITIIYMCMCVCVSLTSSSSYQLWMYTTGPSPPIDLQLLHLEAVCIHRELGALTSSSVYLIGGSPTLVSPIHGLHSKSF